MIVAIQIINSFLSKQLFENPLSPLTGGRREIISKCPDELPLQTDQAL